MQVPEDESVLRETTHDYEDGGVKSAVRPIIWGKEGEGAVVACESWSKSEVGVLYVQTSKW